MTVKTEGTRNAAAQHGGGAHSATASVPATASAQRGGGLELVQLLDEHGNRVSNQEFGAYVDALTSNDLKSFYRDMALARRYDAEATLLQRQGELALWVPLRGQEGAQVGAVHATAEQDYLFPTYREHAVALARGVQPGELITLFRGAAHAGWDPRRTRFHVYTLVLAAQTLHAVGYAMGISKDAQRGITANQPAEAVMAFFGDGSSSEGDVHESMVFAASYNSPVVFFCQNNLWAISVPFAVQSKVPLAERAAGYGFPGVRVDGNDVLATYAVTKWAMDRARNGAGPALIEAETYRLGAHTTADDPTKYRGSDEEEQWSAKDPVTRLETLLRNEGHADQDFFDAVAAEADELAATLRAGLAQATHQDLATQFGNIYNEAHPLVAEEAAWFADYEASFTEDVAGGQA